MQTRADAKRLKDDAEAVVKVSVTRPGVEKSHELPVEEQQQKIRDGPSNREHVKSKARPKPSPVKMFKPPKRTLDTITHPPNNSPNYAQPKVVLRRSRDRVCGADCSSYAAADSASGASAENSSSDQENNESCSDRRQRVVAANERNLHRAIKESLSNADESFAPASVSPTVAMTGNTLQQAAGTKAAAPSSSCPKKGGKRSFASKKAAATTAQASTATKKDGSTSTGGAGHGRDDEGDRGDRSRGKPAPFGNGLMDQPSDSDEDEDHSMRRKSRRKLVRKPNGCQNHLEVEDGDATIIVDEGRDSDCNSSFDEDENNDLALVIPQSADDNNTKRGIVFPVNEANNHNGATVVAQVNNVAAACRDITSHPLYAQVIALRDSVASRNDTLVDGIRTLSINAQSIQNQDNTLSNIVDGLREARLDLRETRAQIKASNEEVHRHTDAMLHDRELDGRIADMLEDLIVGPQEGMARRANLKRSRTELDDDSEEELGRNRRRFRRTQDDGHDAMKAEVSHLSTPQRQIRATKLAYGSPARHLERNISRYHSPFPIDDVAHESDSDPECGVDVTLPLAKERREREAAARKEAQQAPHPPPGSLRAPRQTPHLISGPPPPPAAGADAVATRHEQIKVARAAETALREEIRVARASEVSRRASRLAVADDPYGKLTAAPGIIRPAQGFRSAPRSFSASPRFSTPHADSQATASRSTPGVAQRLNPPPSPPSNSSAATPAHQGPGGQSGRRKKTTMPENLLE